MKKGVEFNIHENSQEEIFSIEDKAPERELKGFRKYFFERVRTPGLDQNVTYTEQDYDIEETRSADQITMERGIAEKIRASVDNFCTENESDSKESHEQTKERCQTILDDLVVNYWKSLMSTAGRSEFEGLFNKMFEAAPSEVENYFKTLASDDNESSIIKTNHWVEILKNVYWSEKEKEWQDNHGESEQTNDKVYEKIKLLLKNLDEKSQDKYFLHNRLANILKDIDTGLSPIGDRLPFEINFEHYAIWLDNGGLAITPMMDDGSIEDDVKMYEEFEAYYLRKLSEISDPDEKNEFISQMNNDLKKAEESIRRNFYFEKIDPKTFANSIVSKGNSEDSVTKLVNFRFLYNREIIGEISRDFHIVFVYEPPETVYRFLNFAQSKTREELRRVMDFSRMYSTDGLNSFLSTELDPAMGERILSIGENLQDSPELANKLFREYSMVAHRATQTAGEIIKSFSLIFPDKLIEQSQVVEAILIKAKDLLFQVSEEIGTSDDEDKEAIVNHAITQLEKQLATQKKEIGEFAEIAGQLNGKYQELLSSELGTKLVNDLAEFQKHLLDMEDTELKQRLLQEQEISGKFSSARIGEIIDHYQSEVDFEQSKEFQIFRGQLSVDQLSEYIAKQRQKIETTYKPLIQKLEKLLSFQVNFEKKLEQIVIGHESGVLPKNLLERLPEEVQEVRPERLPDKEPLFFPVGITKDLPAMQEVWAGKKETAKPIDMYGYLFWLNNQDRPVELVVCDEIQTSNYQALYPELLAGGSDDQAREQARRIGRQEVEQYQRIIETFGLSNITIIDYHTFKERNGNAIEKYKELCERLAKNETWRNAFLSMVQESVSGEEREKFLAYAIEEVSWILSNDGTKVSHENETRYDAIAAIIRNIENYGQKRQIDILDPENEAQFNQAALAAIAGLRNLINGRKDRVTKDSSEYRYYQRIGEHLGKIKLGQVGQPDDFDGKTIAFNFAIPSTGAQSFGWRSRGEKGSESVLKFKEPYSTYFYQGGAELFLNSDQVVAVPEGQIAGKILALDINQQQEYAEKVVKPILVHYFKTLENAPAGFFKLIGKSRTELIAECQSSETLMDLLQFVQKNIISPVQHKETKPVESISSKQKAA
ncbi:MAG: hypothetical protein WCT08_02590 [Patescibacteria group bacterium]|jgi:hypothetical protein